MMCGSSLPLFAVLSFTSARSHGYGSFTGLISDWSYLSAFFVFLGSITTRSCIYHTGWKIHLADGPKSAPLSHGVNAGKSRLFHDQFFCNSQGLLSRPSDR